MRSISARAAALMLVAVVLAAVAGSSVLAHEGRSSTGYDVVVGFLHEPAYEGYLNAVFLEVTRTASQEQDADGPRNETASSTHSADEIDEEPEDHAAAPAPVTGLEDTLDVEVTHVASAQSTGHGARAAIRAPRRLHRGLHPHAARGLPLPVLRQH